MTMPANIDPGVLTEKEKQTLRLICRGHDAKSIARSLGLSVHTINERLRDARRKMAVSSSREAARLLLAAEGGEAALATPNNVGDRQIGEDPPAPKAEEDSAPVSGAGRLQGRLWTLSGVLIMTLSLGLLALAALPQSAPPSAAPVAAQAVAETEVTERARQFLVLLDQARWADAYQQTGAAFRKQNSQKLWTDVSEKVRAPLGKALSRTLISQQNLPAPPDGYEVVKFRTSFPSKPDAVETVSLEQAKGGWVVVAVLVE
jgi:DNA-binding CsgD family transcriptional regulator